MKKAILIILTVSLYIFSSCGGTFSETSSTEETSSSLSSSNTSSVSSTTASTTSSSAIESKASETAQAAPSMPSATASTAEEINLKTLIPPNAKINYINEPTNLSTGESNLVLMEFVYTGNIDDVTAFYKKIGVTGTEEDNKTESYAVQQDPFWRIEGKYQGKSITIYAYQVDNECTITINLYK